jgi:radical SAM protein with 4Fe4S-binding SPASM domain
LQKGSGLFRDNKNEFELVVLEVTNKCNNLCLHCYNFWRENRNSASKNSELSRFNIRTLIRKLKNEIPLKQVAISGGEPLLRKDLPEIVIDLKLENLNTVVITNGTLLSKNLLDRFPEETIFEITLFSSNSITHDRLAGRSCFNDIIENLALIEEHKCKFVLSLVITKYNAQDIKSTIELGIAMGAEAVLFNRINLSRYTYSYAKELVPSVDQLKLSLKAAEKTAQNYGVAVAISVPIPACLINPEDYPHLHFGWCPRGNNSAYYTISSSGELRPCNHSSLILGDLKTESFLKIVNSQMADDYWSIVPAICRKCENKFKSLCLGGCPAAIAECYPSKNSPDPFVQLCMSNQN